MLVWTSSYYLLFVIIQWLMRTLAKWIFIPLVVWLWLQKCIRMKVFICIQTLIMIYVLQSLRLRSLMISLSSLLILLLMHSNFFLKSDWVIRLTIDVHVIAVIIKIIDLLLALRWRRTRLTACKEYKIELTKTLSSLV